MTIPFSPNISRSLRTKLPTSSPLLPSTNISSTFTLSKHFKLSFPSINSQTSPFCFKIMFSLGTPISSATLALAN